MAWHTRVIIDNTIVGTNYSTTDDFLVVWNDIKRIFERPHPVLIVKVYSDDRPGKEWSVASLQEAWDKLGIFVVFS